MATAEVVTAHLRQYGHTVAAHSGRTENADRLRAGGSAGQPVKALVGLRRIRLETMPKALDVGGAVRRVKGRDIRG